MIHLRSVCVLSALVSSAFPLWIVRGPSSWGAARSEDEGGKEQNVWWRGDLPYDCSLNINIPGLALCDC